MKSEGKITVEIHGKLLDKLQAEANRLGIDIDVLVTAKLAEAMASSAAVLPSSGHIRLVDGNWEEIGKQPPRAELWTHAFGAGHAVGSWGIDWGKGESTSATQGQGG
jgi:hypothetical protein